MAFIYYNPNPKGNRVGDCSVRAVSKAMDCSWETAYISLSAEGMELYDMPSANFVWGMFLRKNYFRQRLLDNNCPACTTVAEFAGTHPQGTYVLATQNHLVCVKDGDYYDTWDSGSEVVLYYFEKEV